MGHAVAIKRSSDTYSACDYLPGMSVIMPNDLRLLSADDTRCGVLYKLLSALWEAYNPLIHTVCEAAVGEWDSEGVLRTAYPYWTVLRDNVQRTDRVVDTRDTQSSSSGVGPRSTVQKRPRCLVLTNNDSPEGALQVPEERGRFLWQPLC